jgi:hypothetical protein
MAVGGGTTDATPARAGGGRAFKPGPRWAFGGAVVLALAVAAALVLILSPSHTNPNNTYGPLPAWLPKVKPTTPSLEVATPAKPILQEEQGYTVHAVLPGGSADVTAVGPEFPDYVTQYAQAGKWPAAKLVPSTFFVTFTKVTGSIPLAARDFDLLNGNGQRSLARSVTVKGGGRLPTAIKNGQTVTLVVKAGALEGQGTIRWAPQAPKILAGWVFQLELD